MEKELTLKEKKQKIAECYGGSWKDKVYKMPKYQIDAIYDSFKERGLFDKKNDGTQITFDDILKEKYMANKTYILNFNNKTESGELRVVVLELDNNDMHISTKVGDEAVDILKVLECGNL